MVDEQIKVKCRPRLPTEFHVAGEAIGLLRLPHSALQLDPTLVVIFSLQKWNCGNKASNIFAHDDSLLHKRNVTQLHVGSALR